MSTIVAVSLNYTILDVINPLGKMAKKSVVWKHFIKVPGDSKHVECTLPTTVYIP